MKRTVGSIGGIGAAVNSSCCAASHLPIFPSSWQFEGFHRHFPITALGGINLHKLTSSQARKLPPLLRSLSGLAPVWLAISTSKCASSLPVLHSTSSISSTLHCWVLTARSLVKHYSAGKYQPLTIIALSFRGVISHCVIWPTPSHTALHHSWGLFIFSSDLGPQIISNQQSSFIAAAPPAHFVDPVLSRLAECPCASSVADQPPTDSPRISRSISVSIDLRHDPEDFKRLRSPLAAERPE